MAEDMHGFPYWELVFDKNGSPVDSGAVDRLVSGLATEKITDLFVFSHGWNNDPTKARSLYQRFFGAVRAVVDDGNWSKKPDARIGIAGVIWPSILWPDDEAGAAMNTVVGGGAGAAALGGQPPASSPPPTPSAIKASLAKGYDDPRQMSLIDDLVDMLAKQTETEAALTAFQAKLGELLRSEGTGTPVDRRQPDAAEGAMEHLDDDKWRKLLDTLGTRAMRGQNVGGNAAAFGNPFKKLWAGAKDALRIATYWQMKERAGVIGEKGLGQKVLARIAEGTGIRVHLLGHSFGARLVSFALAGLPQNLTGQHSPVKSLFLLQGAFSHWAFAAKLPHDATRAGGLKGMADRVDGPLLATHSLKDLAVGLSYPAASFANGDDAAAATDQVSRWGAIGHDGAQAVDAAMEQLSAPGKKYPFQRGRWINLDGNNVIIHGGLPSGAHSDIVHPATAWAALAAASIVAA